VKVAVFAAKKYEIAAFDEVNQGFGHELTYFETRLTPATAALAAGYEGVCIFVNDEAGRETIEILAGGGANIIATRSAGYNHIDLVAAEDYDLCITRVPAYSPNAISEFTVGLILTLGRQIHRAYNRVRENNFELEGLQGFEIRDKIIGVFGTGRIGTQVIRNLSGFGPRILAYDLYPNRHVAGLVEFVDDPLDIVRQADILTFHIPLTPDTHHLINAQSIAQMKEGVFLVNTSRGALLDTAAVIEGLKSGKIGFLAIDVYEVEGDLFFQDLSNEVVTDDVFSRLLTFPNVLVTGHQAFLTDRALNSIADTTLSNLAEFERKGNCTQTITLATVSPS